MPSKREIAAGLSRYSGLTALLRLLPSKPVLLVLNYHRIGKAQESPYDSGVFSATAEDFDAQIRCVKKYFHMATLDEAAEIVVAGKKPRSAVALLTFDDGYVDNYRIAFPALASQRVQGVFFLATGFVGSNHIPWWDAAAYIIKRSSPRVIRLGERVIEIGPGSRQAAIEQALSVYKARALGDADTFITLLESECDTTRPDGSERCFLNWEEAAEMARCGMAVGSHTHTHPNLATLSYDQQLAEFKLSKKLLEGCLGIPAQSVAYPYGLRETLSPATFEAARDAGYRLGFSFHGGFNSPGAIDPLNVSRCAVGGGIDRYGFEFAAAIAAVTGRFAS
jgi:peptidoglycan/xylan/chitin deacetylase (PgdA/CDA1 family)